jgi:hypothetical protein
MMSEYTLPRSTILITNQRWASDIADFTEGYRTPRFGPKVGNTADWII